MKTIVDTTTNTSKYLVADDYVVNITDKQIEMGDLSNIDFIIDDLNGSNCSLIQGVTTPDDWFGCKYTCATDGTWAIIEGWVDPRVEEEA
tara:strand:+ start:2949 stop:3218 length:270 start_codon:yes stop_codon:yes gene_type:complete